MDSTDLNSSENYQKLCQLRLKYPKNVIISYYNINSIRNKFNEIEYLLKGKVDVLTIAESKIDSSFPESQFLMQGYSKPYKLDVSINSGGLLVFVNNNIYPQEI